MRNTLARIKSLLPLAALLSSTLVALELNSEAVLANRKDWNFFKGDWKIEKGILTQGNPLGFQQAIYKPTTFGDVSIDFRFRAHNAGAGVKAAGLLLGSQGSCSAYRVHFDTKNNQIIVSRYKHLDGRRELGRKRGLPMKSDVWHQARVELASGKLAVYLGGKLALSINDNTFASGLVGFYTSQGRIDFTQIKFSGAPIANPQEWRIQMDHDVPKEQVAGTVLSTQLLCRQDGRYIGWPTICRTAKNELLAVFSGDRDQHVCPWGKVQMVRSGDEGKTWTKAETICNTPLDDRDAGILETRKGTLVVNWFTSLAFEGALSSSWLRSLEGEAILNQWRLHAEKLTKETKAEWLGNWTRRSEDGGKTWEKPVRQLASAPHGGIELADGRLMMVGRGKADNKLGMLVEVSEDDGRSWKVISRIPINPDDDLNHYHEPHLVEAKSGRLVAMFRYHYHEKGSGRRTEAKCFLRQAESEDGGKTWTSTHTTVIQGYPPHLICLEDGTLVCVYGRRMQPFGEYACLSRDEGKTWDIANEIRLAAATSGDLGYPASTQLADGSIFTVYYQIYSSGEKTSLMGTHWKVNP